MKIPLSKYSSIPTEQQNKRTLDLDRIPLRKVLAKINYEDTLAPRAVAKALPQVEKAARFAAQAYSSGGKIIFAGAGTSGRLGILEAAECPPTYGTDPDRIVALMAGGNSSVFRAKEGAEDDAVMGAKDVAPLISKGDCVIGIAASGVTPYVAGALKAAKKKDCNTALVTCNAKTVLKDADVIIALQTGPEALSGSTRMKAGSATKMALNSITTGAMISIGKAYRNWMVDLRPTNRKLVARAMRLVQNIAGVSPAKAKSLLAASGNNIKAAIVMGRLDVDSQTAGQKLARARGFLKDVIE
jgi:N-acetylmuramic acid 6-phosphate etherase